MTQKFFIVRMHNSRNTFRHTGFLRRLQIPLARLWRIIPPISRKDPLMIPISWTPWLLRTSESLLSLEMSFSRPLVDSSSMLALDSNPLGHFVSVSYLNSVDFKVHLFAFQWVNVWNSSLFLDQWVAQKLVKFICWEKVAFQVHASDIVNVYGDGEMTDYLVRFVANLDPNGNTGINWPKYTPSSPNLLTFLDGPIPLEIAQDTFRQEAIEYLTNVTLTNPIWKREPGTAFLANI